MASRAVFAGSLRTGVLSKYSMQSIDIATVSRYNEWQRKVIGMTVNEVLEKKSFTRYRLSKNSGVPYTTICDICSGKTRIENCSAGAVYKIAKELGVPMEALLESCMDEEPGGEGIPVS